MISIWALSVPYPSLGCETRKSSSEIFTAYSKITIRMWHLKLNSYLSPLKRTYARSYWRPAIRLSILKFSNPIVFFEYKRSICWLHIESFCISGWYNYMNLISKFEDLFSIFLDMIFFQKFSDRSEGHVAGGIVWISVYSRGDTWKGLRSLNTDWCFADVCVRFCIWQTEYR